MDFKNLYYVYFNFKLPCNQITITESKISKEFILDSKFFKTVAIGYIYTKTFQFTFLKNYERQLCSRQDIHRFLK